MVIISLLHYKMAEKSDPWRLCSWYFQSHYDNPSNHHLHVLLGKQSLLSLSSLGSRVIPYHNKIEPFASQNKKLAPAVSLEPILFPSTQTVEDTTGFVIMYISIADMDTLHK